MTGHESHRLTLTEKHRALDDAIAEEMKRPLPDQSLIAGLKKQKLRIKEEIEAV